jgi:hypothetical protein
MFTLEETINILGSSVGPENQIRNLIKLTFLLIINSKETIKANENFLL